VIDEKNKMNTEELKYYIHESIEDIDNEKTLLTIKEMIQHLFTEEKNPNLSEDQKSRIVDSKYQIANGKWAPNEQVNEQVGKWLKK